MNALITITHRTVEHNDPDAAGFTDGYWWTLTTDSPLIGYVESASATADTSEAFARAHLERLVRRVGLDAPTVTVVRRDDLMQRRDDEARVRSLIAERA